MDEKSWQEIVDLLKIRIDQIAAKGIEASELLVFDPPPSEQVIALEQEIGIPLPGEFRDLLKVTGGLQFNWFTETAPFNYVEYGGNDEVDFLRYTEEFTLADAYREFQESYVDYCVEEEQQRSMIKSCFPLYLTDGGGNALVAKLDTDPVEVHLLKSEFCWFISTDPDEEISLISAGLLNFLRNWAAFGGPATETLTEVVTACGNGTLDAGTPAGQALADWMASSN